MNTDFSDNIDFLQNILGLNSNLLHINRCEYVNDINTLLDKQIIDNYEVLGEYNFKKSIWYWSYILPKYSNTLTLESRNLLNYGAKIEESNNNEQLLIKSVLINSTIKIKVFIKKY